MNNIFFISDTHFGHANILKYEAEARPFKTVEDMDEALIKKWNRKVSADDSVYIIGDFSFGNKDYTLKILNRLNGRKFLIRGNHDHVIRNKEISEKFIWIKDCYDLKYKELDFILFHYPIQVWQGQHHNSIHLFGHIHSDKGEHTMKYNIPNSYNVGADVNNLEPISLEEILEKLNYKIG